MNASRQAVQDNGSSRQFLIEKPRIFVDFHNADAQGCLRLNCIGTVEDLSAQKIELQVEQQSSLYSEDLEVDGVVRYSEVEHLWIAVIDWDAVRRIESCSVRKDNNR